MKGRILHITLAWLVSVLGAFAQCPNDNTSIGDLTPASCPGSATNTCVQGGQYVTVNVIQGNSYTFSTCGDTDFDSYLTVYNGAAVVAYDDDACGLQSTITWAATFTGTVNVLVDDLGLFGGCVDNSSCMTLEVSCALPPGSCLSGPVCTGAAADVCATACSLGTLNAPNSCPDGTGSAQVWCGSNIGATAANPYQYQLSCSGGGDMPTFVPEVWYSFVPQGNTIEVNVSGLNNPSIGLWDGDCTGLAGIGCANGSGSATLVVEPVIPGNTYYLQVSGGDATDVDDFQLSITNAFNCDICLTEASISVDPPPTNGFYQNNTPVTFCYTIDTWVQQNINWLHGVQVDFGAGWDQSTLTTVPANSVDGWGAWDWYSSPVTSSIPANGTFPPGFYYETVRDDDFNNSTTDPGDNYGDEGNGGWEFCWTITTQNCPPGTDGMDLGIDVTTTADGESGDWTSVACTPDPSVITNAILTCCPDPILQNLVNNPCNGDCEGSATVIGDGTGPYTYTWVQDSNSSTVHTDNSLAGASTATDLCAGSYTVTVLDEFNGCISDLQITITEPAVVSGSVTSTTPTSCNGASDGEVVVAAAGGTTPYTYNIGSGAQASGTFTGLAAGNYTVTILDAENCQTTVPVSITEPSIVVGALDATVDAYCNGASTGSATVSATGGTPPYTYNIGSGAQASGTFTGLSAGNYTVNILDDNDCPASVNLTIDEPTPVVGALDATVDADCNGAATGSASISASGGTPPYTFDIGAGPQASGAFNGLSSGSYSVTILDDNDCSNIVAITINQPTPVVGSLDNTTDADCNGASTGSATVSASGGTPPYSYDIGSGPVASGSFTGLAAGSYSVTILDDNDCSDVVAITINEPTPVVGSLDATVDADCNGASTGSASVSASGGTPPYSYDIGSGPVTSGNFTGLAAGSYSVTILDDNDCSDIVTITISEPAVLVLSQDAVTDATCGNANGAFTVSATGGTTAYSFDIGSGAQASGTFGSLVAGTYNVTVTDAQGCTDILAVTVADLSGLTASITDQTDADCNGAATGSVTVTASGSTAPYSYDIGAGFVASGTFGSLAAGSYTVTAQDANGCTFPVPVTILEPTPVIGSLDNTTDADCNGASTGSATVSASGGTPPYSYDIGSGPVASGNFTGLAAGSYSVTILDDNDCSDIVAITVNQPTPVVGSIQSQTNPTCFSGTDGEFTISALGGTPTYLFDEGGGTQPSGTFTGYSAGTYSVDVTDANGCLNAVSITLGEPTEVIGAIDNQTDASCSGMADATVDVSASGGNPPYTFNIGNGAQASGAFTGLTAGSHTITIEDAVGCQNSIVVNILEPVSLTADIVTQTEVSCFNGTDGIVEIAAQDGTGPYSFDIGNGTQATGIFNGLSAGTYSVTVADANGCSVQVPVTITEPTELTASIVSQTDLTCFGSNDGQFEVAASGATPAYTYDIGNGPQPTGTFIDLLPNTYTVTIFDANTCQTTIDVVISEPIPLVIDAGSDVTICNGDVATLGASGADTYTWSSTADLSNPNIANPSFDGSSTTTFTVTGTDANGCTDTDDITVTVNPLPVVDAGQDEAICTGFTVQLAASGATSYSWDSPTNLDNGTIPNPTFSGTTTETLTVTGTDGNGCINTDNVTITVNPLPTVDAGSDVAICIGSATQLNASGATNYIWSPATDLDDANISNPTFDGPATSTLTVTGTDANGCVNTDDVTVTVNALLVVDAGANTEICTGESAQLQATGGVAYSWNPATGLDDALIDSPTFSGTTTTTFTVTVTDANGCTNTDDVIITVNSLPLVDAGADEVICTGFTVQLGASGATSYSWDAAINLDDGTISNPTFSGTATESLTVTGTDGNGCTNTDDVLVTVNDLPIVDAGADEVICDGQSVQLQASGGVSYSWGPQNGLNNYAISDPVFSGSATTTYTVTSIDGNGCTDSDEITITVNAILPVDAGIDTAICIGETVQLSATGASTYVWSPTAGLDNPNIENPVYSGTNTTTFTVLGTDANGCNASDDITITIHSLPIIDAGLDEAICIGNQVQLTVSGALTYDWTPAVDLDDAQSTTPTFSGTNTTLLTVTGTDGNGCSSSDDVNVTVNPLPVVDAGLDFEICSGFTYQLAASGATNYVWSPATDLDNANISNPTFSGLTTTNFTVTGTDLNGCVNTDDVTITVNGLPVADAGADVEICIGETTQLNASGASNFSWGPATGLDDATISNPTFSGTATTLFTVTVTDASGCEDTDDVEVTVHALPIIDVGADVATCIGEQVQLSVSGASTYVWSPSADLDDETSTTPTFSGTSTTILTATGIDLNGCVNTDDVEVIVNPLPPVDAGLDDAICFGEVLQLGASGATSYVWNPAADLDNANVSNPTFSGGSTATLTVTGTDGNGCVNTDDVTITVNQLPTINAGVDQSICEEGSAQLEAVGVGSFVWFPGGSLSNPTISNPVATPTSTQEYVVHLTDAAGCLNTDTVIVTVMLNPTAIIVANTEACESEIINFESTSFGTIVSTAWVLGDGNSETATTFDHNYPTEGTYEVILAVTTDEGCSDATTQSIDIHPNPIANFSVADACLIEDVNFLDGSTVNSGSIVAWNWDLGDSNSSTSQNPSHNYNSEGTYSVELLVETDFGCADSITNGVTVYPMPIADFSFTNACADDVAALMDNSSIVSGTIDQWQWVINATDTLFGQFPILDTLPVGIYTTELTVWSDQGCGNSVTNEFEVYPLPIVDFSATTVCHGNETEFTDLSTGTSSYPITNWNWTFGNMEMSSEQNPTFTYENFGINSATLEVVNSAGCKSSVTHNDIFVHPNPVVDFTFTSLFCEHDTVFFTDQSSVIVTSNDSLNAWYWSFDGITSDTTQNTNYIFTEYGGHEVILTAVTNNGCSDTDTQTVHINPLPIVAIAADQFEGCQILPVQFWSESTIPPGYYLDSWAWTFDDGTDTVFAQHPGHDFLGAEPGDTSTSYYDISLTVTSAAGCVASITENELITVYTNPTALYEADRYMTDLNDPIFEFTDQSSEDVVEWYWEFGDGEYTDEINPTHIYPDTGTYFVSLEVITANGCSDTVTHDVVVNPVFVFYIPNSFTPNGDDVNEFFFGQGRGYNEYNLIVYDRWGEEIFESHDDEYHWDGSYKGEQVEQSVYVYRFEIIDWKNHQHIYTGHVTLFR